MYDGDRYWEEYAELIDYYMAEGLSFEEAQIETEERMKEEW